RGDHSALVAELARDRQALLEIALRLLVCPPEVGVLSGDEESPAARHVARLRVLARERVGAKALAEAEQAAVEPIWPQQIDELQPERRAARRAFAPGMRGEQVLTLAVESREPFALLRADDLGPRFFGEGVVIPEVPRACLVAGSRFFEPLERVMPHR